MKNTLIILFATTTLALGVVCVFQWRKVDDQKRTAESLQGEIKQQAQRVAELEAAQQLASKQRSETLKQSADLAAKLQAQRQAEAKIRAKYAAGNPGAEAGKGGPAKEGFGFLAKMMDDPDMQKMIRDQQRVMLDQLYSPLLKKWSLTPEEADKFKDLMGETAMKGMSTAKAFLGGGSSTNSAEAINKLTEDKKGADQQMRELLGDARFAQYQEYQKSVGERVQLNQFKLQAGGGENSLTEAQTEQLLGFMVEEKEKLSAAGQPFLGGQNDVASVQAMMKSGEGVEKLIQAQTAVNDKVFERAKEVLSPGQLEAFGKYQTNQLKMARMGMAMAAKFMAAEKPAKP